MHFLNASPTYEKSLMPNYKQGERILDFGCGQADYVRKLSKIGYDIHGVELFYRSGNFIDATTVHKMIDNLYFREINLYFSGKYQKDIPCYKKTPNKCKELNEFDYEREDRNNATLLEEENKNYKTYYQIDKSSEAFIVSSYLELEVLPNDLFNKMLYNNIEYSYVRHKLSDLNELPSISISNFYNNSISFEINSFSDNTEKIFIDFIKCLKEEPKEEDFINIIKDLKSQYIYDVMPLNQYTIIVGQRFINKGDGYDININESIHQLDSINFTDLNKQMYEENYFVDEAPEYRLVGEGINIFGICKCKQFLCC